MDNLPAHKVSGVREAIKAAGAGLLYLLADFTPNECRNYLTNSGYECE